MAEVNIFEKASRKCLRIDTPRGALPVEDLWKLPLSASAPSARGIGVNLDDLAKEYSKRVKEDETESFVTKSPSKKKNWAIHLGFAILKRIIEVRLEEDERRKRKAQDKARAELLEEMIAKAENKELEGKSVAELKAMLAASTAADEEDED